MQRTAIIMAGGSGERFWPVSRKKKPKQLLNITSKEKSMLAEAIDRISALIPPKDVYIITSELLLKPIREELIDFPPENVIAEPAKRNTAPCLALGAAIITAKYQLPDDQISIAVLTADQIINPESEFIKTIDTALDYVEQNKSLATIGIPPTRPETGYGYIEVDKPFDLEKNEMIKSATAFKEKPDFDTAMRYIKEKNYLWNSGMFFWRFDTFLEKMKSALPEVGNHIKEMEEKYTDKTEKPYNSSNADIEDIYKNFPNISIDYGLMENTSDVVVTRAMFAWDDVGSWDSLDRVRKADNDGNIIEGNADFVDIKDCILVNTSPENVRLTALGVENLVIISTEDAVMVCPKNRVQEIKKIVGKVRDADGNKWL